MHRTPNPKNCFFADQGGMGSNTRNEIYYIGIIDILQDFTIRKAAEFSMRFACTVGLPSRGCCRLGQSLAKAVG